MNLTGLRDFTCARVSVGRTGDSLPVNEVLKLRLAHARAREAVHSTLDTGAIMSELAQVAAKAIAVRSAAPDRSTYLRRPDLGRQLGLESQRLLEDAKDRYDVAFAIVDGLSALAVNRHALPLLQETFQLLPPAQWNIAPVVVVEQGRVAIGDEIGACLGAALALVLIGERPGLSCQDSLGVYLTWNPRRGLTDADRNCISNIHSLGLSYQAAAHTVAFLMSEAKTRKLSGVALKENTKLLEN